MQASNYFSTTVWFDYKPEFLDSLNKASNKYIKDAKKSQKEYIKKYGDFGTSFHSTTLIGDTKFFDFKKYVGEKSWQFLDTQGFDMSHYQTIFSEMWVQEFAKKGGGHHSAHMHWNQHVSGFYFLKCSDKTSYPILHEPRTGARATKLKMKPEQGMVWPVADQVSFTPKPGTIMIFPGYMEHEFSIDLGIEPFRFIHWNIQAVPKEMIRNV